THPAEADHPELHLLAPFVTRQLARRRPRPELSGAAERHPPGGRTTAATRSAPESAVPADERGGAAVVLQVGLRARQLRDDRGRQLLAQLDAPLVEGDDVPDRALGEHLVLLDGALFPQ